ncbi:hypothetical protein B0H19DRAFT_1259583 [Mycena capillaripes]|nr:hypothetical protein B0H19DRAFT_1259583 [Mycena capillaripes]
MSTAFCADFLVHGEISIPELLLSITRDHSVAFGRIDKHLFAANGRSRRKPAPKLDAEDDDALRALAVAGAVGERASFTLYPNPVPALVSALDFVCAVCFFVDIYTPLHTPSRAHVSLVTVHYDHYIYRRLQI